MIEPRSILASRWPSPFAFPRGGGGSGPGGRVSPGGASGKYTVNSANSGISQNTGSLRPVPGAPVLGKGMGKGLNGPRPVRRPTIPAGKPGGSSIGSSGGSRGGSRGIPGGRTPIPPRKPVAGDPHAFSGDEGAAGQLIPPHKLGTLSSLGFGLGLMVLMW